MLPTPANRFRSRSSLASAAALAAVAAPSLLQAQIVWSGALNQTVTATPGNTQVLLDFNQNTIPDSTEAYLEFDAFKGATNVSVSGIASSKTDPSNAFLYVDTPVAFGATIDGGLTYIGEHPADLVPSDGNSYYYAFSYQAAGGPYLGWMELSHSVDGATGTLQQWAYNSVANAPLTAGQTSAVPEPAVTAVLFGLAALGTVWWRHRHRSRLRA